MSKTMKSLLFIGLFAVGMVASVISIAAVIPGSDSAMAFEANIAYAPLEFTGSVSQGTDSTQHTFSVSASVTLIEVELAFSSSYDFDLSLWDDQNRRTGGWTAADHSQKSDIPNDSYSGYSANPETITIDPPATSGTWAVGCYSYRGTGTYTITVTITDSGVDTIAPTVDITSPANGATVSGTVSIAASATDNVGVTKVACNLDGGTWVDDTTSPYTWTWDTTSVADGSTHTINCRAYDLAGNYADDSVTVTVDNSGPDNEITSGVPVTGTLTSVGQTEMWFIDVAANCEQMESILTCGNDDFDLYGRLNAEPTTSTYDWRGYTYGGEEVTTTNPGAGRWYIMVRDYSGSGAYELTVTLTYGGPDTTPPVVSITSPNNGATVSSSNVAVSWSGSDADSGIDYYQVRIDSGSWINKGTGTSHTFSGLSDGSHSAEVLAMDNAGNSATDSVTFTVDTSGPTGEKIGVFFWATDAGTQAVIDKYKDYLEDEGYTKFFDFKDSSNVAYDCQIVDNYEDSDDTIFVYIIGHGNNDGSHSYTAFRPSGSYVYSNTFKSYMDTWEAPRKGILVESCHSGDWADDFSSSPYLAMSTSDETHNSYAYSTLPGEGKFSYYFFYRVRQGYNAVDSFNFAKSYVGSPVQNPKIRDYSTYVWFVN